jgi:hypothetical protein
MRTADNEEQISSSISAGLKTISAIFGAQQIPGKPAISTSGIFANENRQLRTFMVQFA